MSRTLCPRCSPYSVASSIPLPAAGSRAASPAAAARRPALPRRRAAERAGSAAPLGLHPAECRESQARGTRAHDVGWVRMRASSGHPAQSRPPSAVAATSPLGPSYSSRPSAIMSSASKRASRRSDGWCMLASTATPRSACARSTSTTCGGRAGRSPLLPCENLNPGKRLSTHALLRQEPPCTLARCVWLRWTQGCWSTSGRRGWVYQQGEHRTRPASEHACSRGGAHATGPRMPVQAGKLGSLRRAAGSPPGPPCCPGRTWPHPAGAQQGKTPGPLRC